ncbi:nucleotide exchange factor GrpE, partial [Candidatus Woesebacteria bacterium]|nr:nucleotide exchange factor GrpE [Candidatus Woesebacteria bacterium]
AIQLRGQLARALADYQNLAKRVESEKAEFEKISNLRLVVKLLPVLDILKQAQIHLKDQGVAITIKEFEDALKQEGIEELKVSPGDEFDPDAHEVVEVVPGKDNNMISELVLSGWKFVNGPVIRHARVKVIQKGEN